MASAASTSQGQETVIRDLVGPLRRVNLFERQRDRKRERSGLRRGGRAVPVLLVAVVDRASPQAGWISTAVSPPVASIRGNATSRPVLS